MPVINATSFLLLKGTTVIGHSTNTVVSLIQDLPESTTKDSNGWREYIAGLKSGTITAEGLIDYSDNLNFSQFEQMIITRETARFYFKNPVNEKMIISGNGIVTNVSETGQYNSPSKFEVEIQLHGAYVITDATEGKTWDQIFDQWESIATNWENV